MKTKLAFVVFFGWLSISLGMCRAPESLLPEGQHDEAVTARDAGQGIELLALEIQRETGASEPLNSEDVAQVDTSEASVPEQHPIEIKDPSEHLQESLSPDALASPVKPAGLTVYITGNPDDAAVTPKGPGLILMGGSREVDAAFQWWKPKVNGGDVVILRTSGSDGYNDYLFREIGGVDSVVTMLVTSRDLANSAYVKWHIERAEGVFVAGGDQGTYITHWKGTALAAALDVAYQRGAVIGGTSAGLAILGEFSFGALQGSITSAEALADPYARGFVLTRQFLSFAPLRGWITDSHFGQRDRMGRLVAFLARLQQDQWHTSPTGIGVDERTALVIDDKGKGTALGTGAVYVVQTNTPPTRCVAGQSLDASGMTVNKLTTGDTITLPQATTSMTTKPLAAKDGMLQPANPY